MHPLAEDLNRHFQGTIVESLLSKQGRMLYFPRGITAQAQEAGRAKPRFNATAGVAKEKNAPFLLPSLGAAWRGLSPAECVDYAPTGGIPELRRIWRREHIEKNPDLGGVASTLPLVTAGVTHGLAVAADLFTDEGDTLLCAEPAWENYELIFKIKKGAAWSTFRLFGADMKFNVSEIERRLSDAAAPGKTILILNFPHNPTGYSLYNEETEQLIHVLLTAARRGRRLLVIVDDAYFGLYYEDGLFRQSLFARLAGLHENILACKVDGATKEDFAWGFRIGFITLASKGLAREHYDALEQKCLAAVRTSVSSASMPAQSLLVRLLGNQAYKEEKREAFRKLERRYRRVKAILERSPSARLRPLPFNSGYFVAFRTDGVDAPALRERLLKERGVGVIALGPDLLRVSFASVDEEDLEEMFKEIFAAAEEIGNHG
ncbi:MAG: aminotransferase class I/II-fold pyridoxal phosphate-dependent enzyme [Spirochaetales bacterium]|nr:aminotransferase class I/II-fold pyridoxal phosphate-dependent enzyme [Spirochaetales bacterium]